MHEGKKPFKCDICGTGFTFKNTLNRHIQNIHEKIDKGYIEHSVSQDPLDVSEDFLNTNTNGDTSQQS